MPDQIIIDHRNLPWGRRNEHLTKESLQRWLEALHNQANGSATVPDPVRGSWRLTVSLNGFECHQQTWDTMLNSDGWGDEIIPIAQVVHTKSGGGASQVVVIHPDRRSTRAAATRWLACVRCCPLSGAGDPRVLPEGAYSQ